MKIVKIIALGTSSTQIKDILRQALIAGNCALDSANGEKIMNDFEERLQCIAEEAFKMGLSSRDK